MRAANGGMDLGFPRECGKWLISLKGVLIPRAKTREPFAHVI
jgi:hypothetical protein